MKTLKEYLLNENNEIKKFSLKYAANNFEETIKKAEEDNWILDKDYNNWSAGESVTVKLIRNNETLWIIATDRKGLYNGNNPEVFSKLKVEDYQYKKN